MNSNNLKPLYYLPILLFVPFFILHQFNFLPYYFAWDSSLLYTTDSLIINGGGMPGHLFHPDIAVLWFEKFFVFPLAKILGFVSISTMQEFQASFNPQLNMADIVEFLRIIRLYYVYLACCIFYIALVKLFENVIENSSLWFKFIMLSCFALFSFQYVALFLALTPPHTIQIVRYEHMGVLWGTLSFLMMVYAVQTQQKRYIMLMGFFGGMAFLSKIVLLPSLILYFGLFFILNSYHYGFNLNASEKERKQTIITSNVLVGIVFLSLILIGVMLGFDILKKAVFTHDTKLTHLLLTGFPFVFAAGFIAILSHFIYKAKDKWNLIAYYLHRAALYMGFFYVPLLLQLFQKNGVHIFINGYIFSFALGQISMSRITGYNNTSARLGNFNFVVCTQLLVLLIAGGILLWYILKKKNRSLLPIALSIGSIFSIIILNQVFLRGGNEVELGFYTLFISITIFLYLIYQITKNKYVLIVPMVFGIVFQTYNLSTRFKLANSHSINSGEYYFSLNEWYSWAYGAGDTKLYPQTLSKVYLNQTNWEKALYWSRNIAYTKQLLRSVSENPNKLQDSSIAFQGVLLPHHNETLEEISPTIANSLVLAIVNEGVIGVRSDYSFYIATEEGIADGSISDIEATDFKFNNYFVYKITKNIGFKITKDIKAKYVIIADHLAKSL